MEDQNIRSQSISTGDIKQSLNLEISKALYFVTFGFHSSDKMNNYIPNFPNQINHFSPPIRIEGNINDFIIIYKEWLIKNGFRDIIEIVHNTLEHTKFLLTFFSNYKPGESIISKDLYDKYNIDYNDFHYWGLEKQMSYLEKKFPGFFIPKNKNHILTIYKARNCLAHRNGFVSESDYNTESSLKISWEALSPILIRENGEHEWITMGVPFSGPGTPGMARKQYEKEFKNGDILTFNEDEFSNICQSLWLFGNDLHLNLNYYSEKFGYENPDKGKYQVPL